MAKMETRDLKSMNVVISSDLNANISKIFKIIEFEIKLFEPAVANCFAKLKEFIDDFTLNEGMKYLIDIFGDVVRSQVSTERSARCGGKLAA